MLASAQTLRLAFASSRSAMKSSADIAPATASTTNTAHNTFFILCPPICALRLRPKRGIEFLPCQIFVENAASFVVVDNFAESLFCGLVADRVVKSVVEG